MSRFWTVSVISYGNCDPLISHVKILACHGWVAITVGGRWGEGPSHVVDLYQSEPARGGKAPSADRALSWALVLLVLLSLQAHPEGTELSKQVRPYNQMLQNFECIPCPPERQTVVNGQDVCKEADSGHGHGHEGDEEEFKKILPRRASGCFPIEMRVP